MRSTTTPESRVRLSAVEKIDLCRGLFAALVVLAHGLQISWGIHTSAEATLSPLVRNLVVSLFGTGTIYVMGFFVLSGYCIHRSVDRLMREERFPIGHYLFARATRILPLYYAGLLFTAALEPLMSDARPWAWPHGINAEVFIAQLFVVQNLTQTFGSFAPSWSITNEAFYYLFYGLLVSIAAGRRAWAAWVGIAVCLAVAIVTQALYVTVGRSPYVYGTGMLFGLGILWYQGVLVAVYGQALMKHKGVRIAAGCWPAAFASVIVWKFLHLPPHGVYLISGLAFTLLLLGFLSPQDADTARPATAVGGTPRSSLINFIGLISYPMYIFHAPLMMFAGSMLIRGRVEIDWRWTWLALVLLGLFSGAALGWLVERPLMAYRARLLKESKSPKREVLVARPAVYPGAQRRSSGRGVTAR
jgi:peptidoglycan/LPS O-acetylase OafA/YrhL